MAKRLSKPLTFVGTFENFWSNASEMLWAGSVEMIKTLGLTFASCTAKLQLQQIRIIKKMINFVLVAKCLQKPLTLIHIFYARISNKG